MGILNLTPDSFFNQNIFPDNEKIQAHLNLLQKADIIDVGAESTRPGSSKISTSIEIDRLSVINDYDFKNSYLSIDSYKPEVIEHCLIRGFSLINDISGGGKNFENIDLANEYNVPIIIMHMKGNPATMQNNPKYDNVIDEIKSFFDVRFNYASKIGYDLNNIIIDPGIGFGKTLKDNDQIILNLNSFKEKNNSLLIGLSRKSFLSIDNDSPADRLNQSLGVLSLAIYKGADIVRVHDVLETINMTKIIDRLIKN